SPPRTTAIARRHQRSRTSPESRPSRARTPLRRPRNILRQTPRPAARPWKRERPGVRQGARGASSYESHREQGSEHEHYDRRYGAFVPWYFRDDRDADGDQDREPDGEQIQTADQREQLRIGRIGIHELRRAGGQAVAIREV